MCRARNMNERVEIEVLGGRRLSTRLQTVHGCPGLMDFRAEDGVIRPSGMDAEVCTHVLNYLRDGVHFCQPTGSRLREAVRRQARQLGLPELAECLEQKPSNRSSKDPETHSPGSHRTSFISSSQDARESLRFAAKVRSLLDCCRPLAMKVVMDGDMQADAMHACPVCPSTTKGSSCSGLTSPARESSLESQCAGR